MHKETKPIHALITVGMLIVIMFTAIVVFKAEPQVPLIFGCLVAGIVSKVIGYSWDEMLEGMIDGITDCLEAVLILLLIGMLVGSWIACGTVPTLICYGLCIISPRLFLPATMLVCLIVACAIGSWGTVGTVGLAFMGIGTALRLQPPLVAGSIISGAYLGDVVSPLSDCTNLCAAVVKRDVFKVVRQALIPTIPAALAALTLFAVSGMRYVVDDAVMAEGIAPLITALNGQFRITSVTLLPMIVMAVCILKKVPAIPAMLAGSLSGLIIAVTLQGCAVADVLSCLYSGYVCETGSAVIDDLLTAGGLSEMFHSVSIIIIAMAFGGLMRRTKQMEVIVRPIASRIRRDGAMNALTVLTCIFINILLPDQYLGMTVPGQMYGDEYDRRGIDRAKLGAVLLGGDAVTSPLIPWNTCGVYCMTILGVAPAAYLSKAYFCLLLPLTTIIWGLFVKGRNKH